LGTLSEKGSKPFRKKEKIPIIDGNLLKESSKKRVGERKPAFSRAARVPKREVLQTVSICRKGGPKSRKGGPKEGLAK